MTPPPQRYLYLVDLDANEAIALCPLDGMDEAQVIAMEIQLAEEAGVDDPANNLTIRDSATRPLPTEDLLRVWRERHR